MEQVQSAALPALKDKLIDLIEEEIDVNDNFYDVGGNSLLAIQFLNWISHCYKVDFTVKDLFEKTILELAAMIEANMECFVDNKLKY
jgi:hypothetical protein